MPKLTAYPASRFTESTINGETTLVAEESELGSLKETFKVAGDDVHIFTLESFVEAEGNLVATRFSATPTLNALIIH